MILISINSYIYVVADTVNLLISHLSVDASIGNKCNDCSSITDLLILYISLS